ncbi:NERD domain-containing protein [Bacillus sp. ISL-41]|uniref:nuclease-related domain-containing protein n=1 Tax=Bacillus sp. ISL-41 TaxID=2819127 RepID=UPI001BEAB9CA|nr:nuclease-related domain-containing protein [Bacillus sp. ISL-41]MBT2643561.1 NERD domain-containing protein [Bacillus sp. ISL-41]
MIAKRRTIPLRILVNEALLRRLPLDHPKRQEILKDLLIKRAGLKGEQDMDYYISLLNENDFSILQDLRIPLGTNYFQIDFLLLSTKFALLIENKNMPGIIEFDPDFKQVFRKYNDSMEVYDCPVDQVKRQVYQFRNWLNKHNINPPPLEFLVTYSNHGSILQNPSKNLEIFNRVCKGGQLVFKVDEYQNRHQREFLSIKDVKKLAKLLIKSHEPEKQVSASTISPLLK